MVYAKCIKDWEFVDTTGRTIGDPLAVDPHTLAAGGDTFWFQKNPGLHGVQIEFLSTPADPAFYPTLTKLPILCRHRRLGMPASAPLAVYKKLKKAVILVHILSKPAWENGLNEAGRVSYVTEATCSRFRFKWTCHSGRIGATALIFVNHRDSLLIKNRLQWASDKLEVYIRHTPILARLHAGAGRTDIDAYTNQSQA